MKKLDKEKRVALTLGLVFFVALGLILTIVACPAGDMKQGPIDRAVVAPAEQLGRAFAMVAAHVRPCVVSVYSEKTIKYTEPDFPSFGDDFFRQFFGNQMPRQQHPRQREHREHQLGMGSGMILDKQGHVLTNFHVVHDMDELKVQLADKRTFEAVVVGSDPKTDVAVIKIKGHVPRDLPVITLGDSDALRVGDLVMAIGAPFGLQQTVTEGIISATGRSDVGIADYEDFLQTDTPINPGNSGGPLVNMRGEVIGMNAAIATSVGQFAGVGFSIPSNMIKAMLPKLSKGEKIVRGNLGVVVQNVTKDLADQFGLSEAKGVLISQIIKNSPADKAGLKVGDVVVSYDGNSVQDVRYFRNMVAGTKPGDKAKIVVMRKGKEVSITAIIGKQEGETAAAIAPSAGGADTLAKLGLSVQALTPDIAKQLGIESSKGVVITGVEEGSLASLSGLQKGDVIVEANHHPVQNVNELQQVLSKVKDSILLLVNRQGMSLFVVMQIR